MAGPTPLFERELVSLLNLHGVDAWAETPDFILAEAVVEHLNTVRRARLKTATWMGQPLLGDKLAVPSTPEETV